MRAVVLGTIVAAVAFLSYASQSESGFVGSQVQRILAAVTPAPTPRPVGIAGTSPGTNVVSTASASPARQLARAAAVRKSPATETQVFGAHRQQAGLDASRRMPHQVPISRFVETGYDHASARNNALNRPSIRAQLARSKVAAAACDAGQFGNLSGGALVAAVKGATTGCINQLFSVSGPNAYNTFREAQMVTVANALATSAAGYGGNNADSTLQLVLFLRAGYFVQFYDSSVGAYGAPLRTAIRPALDAFVDNANFGLVNDVHGEVLAEFVILLDSSNENARYLPVVKRLLDAYTPGHNAFGFMRMAVNNTYLVTFRGHFNDDFRALVQADPTIVETLYAFADRNIAMLGQPNDYLVTNAGRELARFLQYTGATKVAAQTRAKSLLDRTSVTGPTAKMWVGVGEMVDYYDGANCSYYDLCDFSARVAAAALPISHTCSATLRIRAQAMSASELSSTCAIVNGQEAYFHQKVATGNTPVADDNNVSLEMVVFNSSGDYGTYAGAIYGIDTNNGGMYLEGNPATVGNQARFIAYEAEWLQPAFEIWNLTHEYIHYLDGRFNMYGDFAAAMSQKTVWWVEGFAEYMSYSYRNLVYANAQTQAGLGTYTLSQIHQNDYNSGSTRVYSWGYLAARFMFEQRRSSVSSILGYLRPGNYTGYASYMSSLGTSNDAAFRDWLPCIANPGAPGCDTPGNQPPTANFSATTSGLTATFTDASSDVDGSIGSRWWNFGDGSSSAAINPSRTYRAAGTYTVTLTVTDNRGATATRSQSVTVSAGAPAQALVNGVAKTGLSTRTDRWLSFTMDVPAGASNLRFAMSGGTGDADLYVRYGSEPTTSVYDCRPFAGGNTETCTIGNVQAGRYHVMVRAYQTFSGVSLTGSFDGGVVLPECSGADTRTLGKDCARSNVSAAAGDYAYFYVVVPPGTSQLRIGVSGGTGNADLYVNTLGGWATTTAHNHRSTNAGNNEALVVANPPAGYVYISLHGATAFSGARVTLQY
ncbi:collagenase [Montanilutibacter psychrotolerans]|uniref:collagenase n=1 Tax=Montanilutibacter psychrotolerans TaxID=1327343 RepID=UPI001681A792|nr:collagenase [Lysobacter psychrotolerans]